MFASTVDFRLSLDFFDSSLYTCTAVACLTLALAKLSCLWIVISFNVVVVVFRRLCAPTSNSRTTLNNIDISQQVQFRNIKGGLQSFHEAGL